MNHHRSFNLLALRHRWRLTGVVVAALAIVLVVATITATGPTVDAQPSVAKSTSPVVWFEDGNHDQGELVPGASSTLLRTPAGITMSFKTSQLEEGHAYTIWWVVFNDPDECMGGGCGPDDVGAVIFGEGNPNPAGIGILYAAGHVVGDSGTATFSGHLRPGDTSGCVNEGPPQSADSVGVDLALVCMALDDPYTAEVHLVLHDHGPIVPGQVASQISTFEGGCGTFVLPANIAGTDDDVVLFEYNLGTYACFSPQASVHMP
jgi:hypothetical protein